MNTTTKPGKQEAREKLLREISWIDRNLTLAVSGVDATRLEQRRVLVERELAALNEQEFEP